MSEEADHPEQGWGRLWDVFDAALEKDPSERAGFLEEACGSDRELRREVERLLASDSEKAGVLDEPAVLGLDPAGPEDARFGPGRDVDLPEGNRETSRETLDRVKILAGRFEIIRPLGRGGSGAVYEAYDRDLGTSVALKTLRPEIALDPEARKRFRNEINLARRVTHPNACRIFDLFHHGEKTVFLTMELLEGRNLAEHLQRVGPMGIPEVLGIVEQVAAALTAAHEVGVVHRDLKSANVMLVPCDEGTRAVVTDFGIATSTLPAEESALHLTRTGQVLGTPAYMAPEQLQGGKITPATDVYALGLMIYEMLTGELPFAGDTPFSVAAQRLHEPAPSPRLLLPDLDRNWERTILRCLRRDPEDRFRTPADVVAALHGEVVVDPKGEVVPGSSSPEPRAGLGIGLGAAAAAVLVVGTFLLWSWASREGLESSGSNGVAGAAGSEAVLAFDERDWVLIAAFENRTGEAIFDGTLEAALGRELSNSRFVNVVPPERVQDTLRLMRQPPDTLVDAAVGREICLRDGGIRALVTGRVEKLGTVYLLSAELLDPTEGVIAASLSEEAQGQDEVLPAMRRFSNRLREILGEELSLISQSDEELAQVTTPSLRALQLYTQANLIMVSNQDRRPAAELLQQAIALDPEFASAYIHLAYAVEARTAEQLGYAQRALDLADNTTEVERYFIRASNFSFLGQYDESIANNQALLRIDRDHYWANNNMVHILSRWTLRFEEAVPYAVRKAALSPNNFRAHYDAAQALAIFANRPEDAAPYIQRALELATEEGLENVRVEWLRFRAVQERWRRGDVEGVLDEVDRQVQTLESPAGSERSRDAFAQFAGGFYVALGRLEVAEETFRRHISGSRRDTQLFQVAIARNGEQNPGDDVVVPRSSRFQNLAWVAIQLARAARLPEARELVADIEARWSLAGPLARTTNTPYLAIARGELALAERPAEVEISALRDAVSVLRPVGDPVYFAGAGALARILIERGDDEGARRTLEDAGRQRSRTYPVLEEGRLFSFAQPAWMNVRWQLAQLYRKLGRLPEALRIENELRELLTYADLDVWLLRQLQALEEPGAVPSPSS